MALFQMMSEYQDDQIIFDRIPKKNYKTTKSEEIFRGSKYRGVSKNGK